MSATRRRRQGFTIVEMLVVIGIIAVLAGMLLPAVGKATRTARKAEENSRLRQVGVAWNLYANANDDGALPGFLPADVQEYWRVNYQLPDKMADSGVANVPVGQVPPADAQSWPWRLASYLDYSQDVLVGYQELDDMSKLRMSEFQLQDPDGMLRPVKIAAQPAFGYNAYYVGGWWEMVDVEGQLQPRHKFNNVEPLDAFGNPIPSPSGGNVKANVVVRTPSAVRNSSDLIIFCSSAERPAGQYRKTEDFEIGAHYVVAPILENERMWGMSTMHSSPNVIDVAASLTAVPIGRYTGQVSVLRADLHTDSQTPGALDDQRLWINPADYRTYTHQPSS